MNMMEWGEPSKMRVWQARDRIMQTIHHDAVQLEWECTESTASCVTEEDCVQCRQEKVENMQKLVEMYKNCMESGNNVWIDVTQVKMVTERQW